MDDPPQPGRVVPAQVGQHCDSSTRPDLPEWTDVRHSHQSQFLFLRFAVKVMTVMMPVNQQGVLCTIKCTVMVL